MKVELKPLDSKYYETEIVISDDDWYSNVYVRLCGHPTFTPSPREIENGWEQDYGMDHVEDHGVYNIAKLIYDELRCRL